MKVYQELLERGLIAQSTCSEDIERLLNDGSQSIYIGFDATAKSLHIGSLLQLIILKRLQDAGHRPILLIGGGTTMVGDPSGRSDMRKMICSDEIARNTECFKNQFAKIIDFNNERALIVNNADWLLGLSYLPFLQEVGVHFSVNRMLSAECYKQRMEKGLSFLELNYMVMQGYDFLTLFEKYNCRIELGGDDQWSNIIAGVELVRRIKRKSVYGMTFNLLTTSEGIKMGKTQKGAIWLDPDMTSPFDFYQYFRNVDDKDVPKCLKFLTSLPLEQIHEMEYWSGERVNDAKKILAYEVTKLVHGDALAKQIELSSKSIFSGYSIDTDIPTTEMPITNRIQVLDLLLATKLVESKSEGRRLIDGGGIVINDERIVDNSMILDLTRFELRELIIRKGKKTFHRVRLVETA